MLDKEKLKSLMKVKNIRQQELAIRAGISKHQISKYLQGHSQPVHEKIKKMADVLNVNASSLMLDEHETPKKSSQKLKLCFCPSCGVNLELLT